MEGGRGEPISDHRVGLPLIYLFIARRLLKSMSIKQGVKYDDPVSARDIPAFIEFHKLNVDEILGPLDSFSTLIHLRFHGNHLTRNLFGQM